MINRINKFIEMGGDVFIFLNDSQGLRENTEDYIFGVIIGLTSFGNLKINGVSKDNGALIEGTLLQIPNNLLKYFEIVGDEIHNNRDIH